MRPFLHMHRLSWLLSQYSDLTMLGWWRDRQYRIAKDKRDADELIRKYGDEAYERCVKNAESFVKGSREERHWTRVAKVIKRR